MKILPQNSEGIVSFSSCILSTAILCLCFNSANENFEAILICNFGYVTCSLHFLWKLLFISHILQCHTSKLHCGSALIYCAECSLGLFNVETHVLYFCHFLDFILWWLSPFHFSFFVDLLWSGYLASSMDILIFFYFLSLCLFFSLFSGRFTQCYLPNLFIIF